MSSLFVGEHPTHLTVVVVQGSTADLVVPADTGALAAPVLEFTANRSGEPSVTHALVMESGEWVVHLSSVQVAALAGLHFARVKDAGRVVAAGQVQHNPGWSGRSESRVVTTRIIWGGGGGGTGGGGSGPLVEFTGLPADPVPWLPYQYRVTSTTALPGSIVWAAGPPVIGGWGVIVLIWDGAAWCGEWTEKRGTPPGPTWSATLTTGAPSPTSVTVTASALATGATGYEFSLTAGSIYAPVTPSGNLFTLTGLTPGKAYSAPRLRARDAAGNVSPHLSAQGFTTPAQSGGGGTSGFALAGDGTPYLAPTGTAGLAIAADGTPYLSPTGTTVIAIAPDNTPYLTGAN